MSKSFEDLRSVAQWLGHWAQGLRLSDQCKLKTQHEGSFKVVVENLKKLMIRHTKGQRIGGAEALSLPTLESETQWLSMKAPERKMSVLISIQKPSKKGPL